jgi:glycine cleavage system H lipoate-binding protein
MLETALKEVTSAEAIREINCAIASIENMRKAILEVPVKVKIVERREYRKAKYKGVYRTANGKPWMVKIRNKQIGVFGTEELAAEAAEKYRETLRKEM